MHKIGLCNGNAVDLQLVDTQFEYRTYYQVRFLWSSSIHPGKGSNTTSKSATTLSDPFIFFTHEYLTIKYFIKEVVNPRPACVLCAACEDYV
jgi:hypothetical protein